MHSQKPTTHQARPRMSAWIAALGLLTAPGAWAQDEAAMDKALPLWEAGVLAGALSTPAYPASNERNRRVLVLPYFVYRGDVWRADRGGLGARMLHTDTMELDIGFAASLPVSSDDLELRRGMSDLGTLIEFGPRLKVRLAEPAPGQRLSLELPLRAVLEFNGGVRQVGNALEPKLAYEWRQADWRIGSALSLVVGDQQLNQYFYGVPAANATASRPAYEAQAGLISTRLTVDTSKRVSADLSLYAYARQDLHNGSSNRSSPLFAQNQGSSIGVGLAWTLGRSVARAGERP